MSETFRLGFLMAAVLTSAQARAVTAPTDVWILVEVKPRVLKVMEGERVREAFPHIAIGSMGASYEKRRGDDKTPLGEYRIGWVNARSRFHNFFGLTYPNMANARRAYQSGLIEEETFRTLLDADINGAVPPQNTPLGGQIGIHGIGGGSSGVHADYDWTHGCIALTNEQIDRLKSWARPGTRVVIR